MYKTGTFFEFSSFFFFYLKRLSLLVGMVLKLVRKQPIHQILPQLSN